MLKMPLMRTILWVFRAILFFALFAFALNNEHEVTVHWFFGHEWSAPLVIIVLLVFAIGCTFGVLAMVPAWWRQRRQAQRTIAPAPAAPTASNPLNHTETPPDEF